MLVTLDFETEAIENRPAYPPTPVGLAVKMGDAPGTYLSWGHPTKNNCDQEMAYDALVDFIQNEENEFIFHNAPFDISIIEEKFLLDFPWGRCHDTMLMAFLANPHGELSLKPLAELLLHEPPAERDAVRDWLVAHVIASSTSKSWGEHISNAPGDLVGRYAVGDVERTYALFQHFKANLTARGLV
jgi:DNA polymerase I-like protein with 3'-5' exonuclease and polymerase domains